MHDHQHLAGIDGGVEIGDVASGQKAEFKPVGRYDVGQRQQFCLQGLSYLRFDIEVVGVAQNWIENVDAATDFPPPAVECFLDRDRLMCRTQIAGDHEINPPKRIKQRQRSHNFGEIIIGGDAAAAAAISGMGGECDGVHGKGMMPHCRQHRCCDAVSHKTKCDRRLDGQNLFHSKRCAAKMSKRQFEMKGFTMASRALGCFALTIAGR